MTNHREILRLDSLGLNKTLISEACGCSRTTVVQTLRLLNENRLEYPLPDSMSDKQLADLHLLNPRLSNLMISRYLVII